MKRLRLVRSRNGDNNVRDVHQIVEFMNEKGYEVLPLDVYEAWQSYSRSNYLVGWISVTSNTMELFLAQQKQYFYEVEPT